jgi:bifunctional DNA-binding transcriptional regulator/antitoxin component of YhaV-PrlF toxin-antitoxin module
MNLLTKHISKLEYDELNDDYIVVIPDEVLIALDLKIGDDVNYEYDPITCSIILRKVTNES